MKDQGVLGTNKSEKGYEYRYKKEICKMQNCKTVISQLSNKDGEYCLKCNKIMIQREDEAIEEIKFQERLKKGIQVTLWLDINDSLDFAISSLKGKNIKIKKRVSLKGMKEQHAVFRYS